jgi:uncharacterized phiE125 gp8 family phage protein
MIMHSKVIVQPAVEPLTVAEAKYHCKVDDTSGDESNYFSRLITRARRIAENYSGLSFLTQTRQLSLDYFPCGVIEIPYGPVQSVEMEYYNSAGSLITMVEGTDFRISGDRIQAIDGWPTVKNMIDAVTIVYVAGFTNTGEDHLPEEAIDACARLVARFYEKRGDEDFTPLTDKIMDILDNIKVHWNAHY